MIHNRKFALLLAFAICTAGFPLRAQNAPEKRIEKRFEVMHMFINSIQVRNPDNLLEIHTFAYSDQIRDHMQELFGKGGYQYGDRVKIVYRPGEEVALRIKGRHSKPVQH